MSKAITASIVPLFDRLSGFAHASQDGRLLDAGGLQHSLRLDLERLFNVRNALTIEEYLTREPSVLHYGLPDSLGLSPQSQLDREIWASVLQRCIELYEPRLSHVQVTVKPDPARPYGAQASIAGAVMLGQQLCRVNFEVTLDARSATIATAA
jgi:type VI secretion system protein ImpF